MSETETLPPLTFSSLFVGREFGPSRFVADEKIVAAYIAVTGDDDPIYTDPEAARQAGFEGPVVPPGLAGVWARKSYLAEHRMLPGGVMAGQDYELRRAVPVGAPLELTATVLEKDEGGDRQRVVLSCEARDPEGELVGRVRIDARWPEGDG